MKKTSHFTLVIVLLFLAACRATNPVSGEFHNQIRAQGFASFNQPIGDPHNPNDWNKFGPGTVLHAKTQSYYYPAKRCLAIKACKTL